MSVLTNESIQSEVDRLAQAVSELDARIAEISERRNALRSERDAWVEVLRARGALRTENKDAREIEISTERDDGGSVPPGTRISHDRVVEAVVDELRAAERPLTVQELLDRLKGRAVPEDWVTSNISAHLGRATDQVTRVKRGEYGLAEWGDPKANDFRAQR